MRDQRSTITTVLVELWLDGDAAPAVGAELHGLGVRAECWSVAPASSPHDRVDALVSVGDGRPPRHEITGSLGDVREIPVVGGDPEDVARGEFVLTVRAADGELRFLGDAVMAGVGPVAPGSRVSVVCRLSVIPDHEWEAFGLPEQVRASWRVERVEDADEGSVVLDLRRI